MKNLVVLLRSLFTAAVERAFGPAAAAELAGTNIVDRVIAGSKNATPGSDFKSPVALSLFGKLPKLLGAEAAPKSKPDVAQAIVDAFPENDVCEWVRVTGPGHIELAVRNSFLNELLTRDVLANELTAPEGVQPERVLVDFSSPNIAKEMHVGHLRSTILGECICRLLEFCGYDVLRINHVGDWGTQFGMLICHLKDVHPDFITNPPPISDLVAFYRESKRRFDSDPEFKERSREEVVRLQSGDATNLHAWRALCELSRVEFDKIYQRLDVRLSERGESFYNPMLPKVVEDLEAGGFLTDDKGARVFHIEGQPCPLMVRKGDGGYTYDTTDLAAVRYRINEDRATWVIYVVDQGQSTHFDLVFAGAKLAGWVPENVRLTHVGFGLVLGEDSKKLKTRSGDTVRLVDLLDEAVERTSTVIRERSAAVASTSAAASSSAAAAAAAPTGDEEVADVDLSEDEVRRRAEAIGYSAVKYMDLKNKRTTDYRFSFDAMLSLKGNSAVYLMYQYARIRSIARKVGVDPATLVGTERLDIREPQEHRLALHLTRFADIIQMTVEELAPHRMTEYLWELSTFFSEFYSACRVRGSPEQGSRLLLCEATLAIMAKCFYILGLQTLERI